MADTLPTLAIEEHRKHRLTLNLTQTEADSITALCLREGVLNRAAVARALVLEGLQRRTPQAVA